MKTVFAVVSSVDETVAILTDERKAIKMADSYGNGFTVRGFKLDDNDMSCGWLVWMRGVSESQIEHANIIASKKYVKTPPEVYAKALRQLLAQGYSLEDLSRRIEKPVKWLQNILLNNPEPSIPPAEVTKDEVVLDDSGDRGKRGSADWSGPEYDPRTYE
jgi:hypothetical protein